MKIAVAANMPRVIKRPAKHCTSVEAFAWLLNVATARSHMFPKAKLFNFGATVLHCF